MDKYGHAFTVLLSVGKRQNTFAEVLITNESIDYTDCVRKKTGQWDVHSQEKIVV